MSWTAIDRLVSGIFITVTALCVASAALGGCGVIGQGDGIDDTPECDTCHGNPPASPHPESAECYACHGETVKEDGTIDAEGGFHMNGTTDLDSPHPEGYAAPDQHGVEFNTDGASGCTSCHGGDLTGGTVGVSCEQCHPSFRTNCTFCHGGVDNDTGAPPEGVFGEAATDEIAVGAHTAHLAAEPSWHKEFGCTACHEVPADALDAGHIDGTVGHSWGELATAGSAVPVWDGTSCSGVYCHGVKSSGGTQTAPEWTTVDGSQSTCGACHGLPPTENHPPMDDCSKCHGCVADEDQAIRPEGAPFHIDGKVNMEKEGECPGS